MHVTALPDGVGQLLPDGLLESGVIVTDRELYPTEPACFEPTQSENEIGGRFYWSATTHGPNYAWGVGFNDGHVPDDYKPFQDVFRRAILTPKPG